MGSVPGSRSAAESPAPLERDGPAWQRSISRAQTIQAASRWRPLAHPPTVPAHRQMFARPPSLAAHGPPDGAMSQHSDSRAVKLASPQGEAWARKAFQTARNGVATDVKATQSSTNPEIPRHDLTDIED